MLRKIIKLFHERKAISLFDLLIHFKIDEKAIEGMLNILIKKGYLQKLNNQCITRNSNVCKTCPFERQNDIYLWIEKN